MTGKSHIKFTYQQYDYSFLKPKPSWFEAKVLPIAERVYAKTIGADIVTTKPMNEEPVGQLFWFEPSFTAAAEPDNTASATTNDSVSDVAARILDASNAIAEKSSKGKANYTIVNPSIFYDYDYSGYRKKLREERTREYFKRKNYFKKIRNR